MRVLVWLPFAAAPALAVTAGPIARRLAPRAAALCLAGAALLAGSCWLVALGLVAATAIGQIPWLAAIGEFSTTVVRLGDPVPRPLGIAASVLLGGVSIALLVAAARRAAGLIAAERMVHRHRDRALVVLQDEVPRAYAIGGLVRGRIAVSTGMLAVLTDRERAAMLAHERAHLRGRHHLLVVTTGLAAAGNPLLRALPGLVAAACERWADEAAAHAVGDRRIAAEALAHAALAIGTTPAAAGCALLGGDVPHRVASLLRPPTRSWAPLYPLLGTAGLVLLLATAHATRDLQVLLIHARAAGG